MFDTHGCPAYVSPEILNSGGCYSGKQADAWSLGVMLYTMLVGRYPFHDPDPATLFSKIRRGTYCLPDGLSLRARCLLRSLLRKDPGERLTTADVLIHPWFNGNTQDTENAEQQINLREQTVPQIEMEQDEDLFSWGNQYSLNMDQNCWLSWCFVFIIWFLIWIL